MSEQNITSEIVSLRNENAVLKEERKRITPRIIKANSRADNPRL